MSISPRVYWERARSPSAGPDELARLAGSPYEFVVAAVAANPGAPPPVLAALGRSPHDMVVEKVAANPSTPLSALAALAVASDAQVLTALAANPSATSVILRRVADALLASREPARFIGSEFSAVVCLCRHPRTPSDSLIELVSCDRATRRLRKVVARETTHQVVVALLAGDRSEVVRRAARKRVVPSES